VGIIRYNDINLPHSVNKRLVGLGFGRLTLHTLLISIFRPGHGLWNKMYCLNTLKHIYYCVRGSIPERS